MLYIDKMENQQKRSNHPEYFNLFKHIYRKVEYCILLFSSENK